jgi:hypothetical protein
VRHRPLDLPRRCQARAASRWRRWGLGFPFCYANRPLRTHGCAAQPPHLVATAGEGIRACLAISVPCASLSYVLGRHPSARPQAPPGHADWLTGRRGNRRCVACPAAGHREGLTEGNSAPSERLIQLRRCPSPHRHFRSAGNTRRVRLPRSSADSSPRRRSDPRPSSFRKAPFDRPIDRPGRCPPVLTNLGRT